MANITGTQIKTTVESLLDAEGSDHYRDLQDYIPAINDTQMWAASTICSQIGTRRFSEKAMSMLMYEKVWQTNAYGRILFSGDQLGGEGPIMDIVALYAEPVVAGVLPTPQPAQDWFSQPRKDLVMIDQGVPVKRITDEQLAHVKRNTFAEGSLYLTDPELASYYYRVVGYDRATNYPTVGEMLEIGPRQRTSKKLIGLRYIKVPNQITAITDPIEFPPTLLALFAAKVLNFISVKQGDGTNAYGVGRDWTSELFATVGA